MKYARTTTAAVAFAAFASGLYLIDPALALIIPGGLVFAALSWTHIRGRN